MYSLSLRQPKTYIFTLIFTAGNLLLPFVIHHLPPVFAGVNNGLVLLPIYFFTLIAAYKFGVHVGLLTAVLSLFANNLLFGMPVTAMVPVILVKSILLVFAAVFFARNAGKVSFWAILFTIAAYQFFGSIFEWLITDFRTATTDFRIGFLGMFLQLFGGYFILKFLEKRNY